jgi:3'-5' exoribonuclease
LKGITRDRKRAFFPETTFARILSDNEIVRGNYLHKVVVCTDERVEALKAKFADIIATIGNKSLRVVVGEVIDEVKEDFFDKAAAISMHHACQNRLREHLVPTSRACIKLLSLYPFVDHDLTITRLRLHDVGKVLEYTSDVFAQRTKIGVLQGHLILGYRFVGKIAMQNKLEGEVLERLDPILLSHHGDPEFGAVVGPATPEAIFVALFDNLDAKMGMVEQYLHSTPSTNAFSDFHKGLESKLLVYRLVKKLRFSQKYNNGVWHSKLKGILLIDRSKCL